MTTISCTSMFQPSTRSRHISRLLAATAVILLLAGCSGEGKQESKQGKSGRRPAAPVATAICSTRDVPVGIEASGRVEASASAEIRSQVGGILDTVHFTEGGHVRRGDILFTIDPRPYRAVVQAREADLAKDRAELANAEKELQRYIPAAGKGFVSQTQADQAATRVASLKAAVLADEAALESARIDLQHCSLTAPFDGKAGEIAADAGNLVEPGGSTPLVTINRISPIDVSFDIAGDRLAEVRKAMADKRLEVAAAVPGTSATTVQGQLAFIDNAINPATGTIRLKAGFANSGSELWPGQLAKVTLIIGNRRDALVIPEQAVQIGQGGAHVFVVRKDDTVAFREVVTGLSHDGLTVIEKGLAAGERVVTDGHLQLVDGGAVVDRNRTPQAKTKGKPTDKDGGK